jgi:hypothetical protein
MKQCNNLLIEIVNNVILTKILRILPWKYTEFSNIEAQGF